jgi:hypothetical protein
MGFFEGFKFYEPKLAAKGSMKTKIKKSFWISVKTGVCDKSVDVNVRNFSTL